MDEGKALPKAPDLDGIRVEIPDTALSIQDREQVLRVAPERTLFASRDIEIATGVGTSNQLELTRYPESSQLNRSAFALPKAPDR